MMVWMEETAKLKVHLWVRHDKLCWVGGGSLDPGRGEGGNNTASRLMLQRPEWPSMPLKLSLTKN